MRLSHCRRRSLPTGADDRTQHKKDDCHQTLTMFIDDALLLRGTYRNNVFQGSSGNFPHMDGTNLLIRLFKTLLSDQVAQILIQQRGVFVLLRRKFIYVFYCLLKKYFWASGCHVTCSSNCDHYAKHCLTAQPCYVFFLSDYYGYHCHISTTTLLW